MSSYKFYLLEKEIKKLSYKNRVKCVCYIKNMISTLSLQRDGNFIIFNLKTISDDDHEKLSVYINNLNSEISI